MENHRWLYLSGWIKAPEPFVVDPDGLAVARPVGVSPLDFDVAYLAHGAGEGRLEKEPALLNDSG